MLSDFEKSWNQKLDERWQRCCEKVSKKKSASTERPVTFNRVNSISDPYQKVDLCAKAILSFAYQDFQEALRFKKEIVKINDTMGKQLQDIPWIEDGDIWPHVHLGEEDLIDESDKEIDKLLKLERFYFDQVKKHQYLLEGIKRSGVYAELERYGEEEMLNNYVGMFDHLKACGFDEELINNFIVEDVFSLPFGKFRSLVDKLVDLGQEVFEKPPAKKRKVTSRGLSTLRRDLKKIGIPETELGEVISLLAKPSSKKLQEFDLPLVAIKEMLQDYHFTIDEVKLVLRHALPLMRLKGGDFNSTWLINTLPLFKNAKELCEYLQDEWRQLLL